MVIATLWIAQVVVFVGAWLGPWGEAGELGTTGRVTRPVRMLVSASLVLAALLIYRDAGGVVFRYAAWVSLGMAASFVGDLIMARLIPVPSRLVGGMVAFGVGHACYVTGYVRTLHAAGQPVVGPALWLGLFGYGVVTVGGWWVAIRNPQREPAVNVGALVYGSWIGVMASVALALASALGGAWWATAAGALSFVASDFLIGLTDIRGVRIRRANDWIWVTYVAGQMGIVYAGWLATVWLAGSGG